MRKKKHKIYLIINRDTAKKFGRNIYRIAESAGKARVDFIQFRFGNTGSRQVMKESLKLREIILKYKTTKIIINNRPDIAKAVSADGVHLGNTDLSPEAVRKLLGKNAVIGKTVHSIKEISNALKEPVNYLSFGPVFRTPIKPNLRPWGIDKIKKAVDIFLSSKKGKDMDYFVIGGITLNNIGSILKKGITHIALSTEVLINSRPMKVLEKINKVCLSI